MTAFHGQTRIRRATIGRLASVRLGDPPLLRAGVRTELCRVSGMGPYGSHPIRVLSRIGRRRIRS